MCFWPADRYALKSVPASLQMLRFSKDVARRRSVIRGAWVMTPSPPPTPGKLRHSECSALMIDYLAPSLDTTISGIASALALVRFASGPVGYLAGAACRPCNQGGADFARAGDAFNAAEQQVQVKLITLPVGDYAQQVQAAAAHGSLPDLLDFDGPNLYNYAWSGKLKPIDSCVSKSLREDLLPSIIEQGSYADRLWGIGTFDSGLGLYVRPSILMKAGIRIPTGPADAWTADEFTTVLQRLRQAGFERPLDLQLNEPNPEWYTYGFAPAVWSAGGDLIDRTDYRTVDGFLNGPGAVKAFTILQRWFTEGFVDRNATGDAFEEDRSPNLMDWTLVL